MFYSKLYLLCDVFHSIAGVSLATGAVGEVPVAPQ